MFILNTHTHRLIFRINSDATKDYVSRWKEIKRHCENGNNKYIVEQMKT